MGGYAVAWIVAILGVALLGEAARMGGHVFGGRSATWIALLGGTGFVGCILATASQERASRRAYCHRPHLGRGPYDAIPSIHRRFIVPWFDGCRGDGTSW